MPSALIRDLGLEAHGLQLAARNLPTVALAADGRHLSFGPGNLAELAAHSGTDAAALTDWQALLGRRFARALHPVLTETPPRLGSDAWRDRAALLGLGWRIRRLGRHDMRELLRIGGMCVHDLLEDRFRLPLLKGALALDAVLGTNYGPRSPGTVLTLLYRAAASGGADCLALPRGGLGAVSAALARAAAGAGAEIRTGVPVARIQVRDDRVAGVVLASGEEIAATTVVSSADPKSTFLGLLGAEHLDAGFVRRVSQVRSRGLTAKLHLALERLPQFPGLGEEQLRAGASWSRLPADYIERAYNHAKYDEYLPRADARDHDPDAHRSGAWLPPARHVMSVIVQYAPHSPGAGWAGQRQSFTDRIIDTLAAHAPQLRDDIRASELLTPVDIEREFRISGGHWHHAELALDQFLMVRPVPGAAQYRTPVPGLFLCGAGCHPGGGVMGLPGRNAAQQVLRKAA